MTPEGLPEETTASIAYNATAFEIQSALEALPNIGAGNVSVTERGATHSLYWIMFTGVLDTIPVSIIPDNKLIGGTIGASSVAAVRYAPVVVLATNTGATPTNGEPVTVTDTLPAA